MENSIISVNNLRKEFSTKLSGFYHDEEIAQIIYMLFEEYLGWSKTQVHLSHNSEIPQTVLSLLTKALDDLCTGKPIQYILGKAWFNGILLIVDPRVLIPRPETEELCAIIGNSFKDNQNQVHSIIDVGTGSGCISIDLKKRFPDASVTGIDASRDALDIALKNALENHCEINLFQSDILCRNDWKKFGRFNLIVSNPPYVLESEKKLMNRNVTAFEPSQALFVTDNDPLEFYRAIADFAVSHLFHPGHLFFEINEQFGKEIVDLLLSFGFSDVGILTDIHGKERFVRGYLV